MNYRHSFHAGNFADVFKHVVLIGLIQNLLKKPSSFCYLETHAGAGNYHLLAENTQKNPEYLDGIAKIFQESHTAEPLQTYLNYLKKINPTDLQHYPGSPELVKSLLRPMDRMVLAELHPDDYQVLKKIFRHDKQVAIHHQDGYQMLKALSPPKEKRGLVLIDPPYENKNELANLPNLLSPILKHWCYGIYAIWYPIKNYAEIEYFYRLIRQTIPGAHLAIEFCIYPADIPTRLNGSGMLIINPPWQFETQITASIDFLWQKMHLHKNGFLRFISMQQS